ncbi:MAG: hypothetical protein NUW12_01510 [Firmicutes bacterium]|nr:hypothetical protein [Bacillota bacterium]MDH7494623.1 hypothetical protein [Bacillota bacterium]
MGLDTIATAWVPSITFLGGGFFLMAVGVPISSLAMFSFLAIAMQARGWSWLYSALVAGFFTAAGHAGSYVVFRAAGNPIFERLARRQPEASRVLARLKAAIGRGHPRVALELFALRWVGAGYSQVFWLLGVLGSGTANTVRNLLLADLLWAATWSWALANVIPDAPALARHMSVAGWVLLGAGVLAAVARQVASRVRANSGPRRR